MTDTTEQMLPESLESKKSTPVRENRASSAEPQAQDVMGIISKLKEEQLKGLVAESKPAIFLALQGGGAKGIVHIGGVTAITDLDFEIRGVSGTSAGAIVAALLAAGYSPQELFNLDSEGNLFQSLPTELGVSKPTDLFPKWGWRTLWLLRWIQRLFKRTKDPKPQTIQQQGKQKGKQSQPKSPANKSGALKRASNWVIETVKGSFIATCRFLVKGWATVKVWALPTVIAVIIAGLAYLVSPKLKEMDRVTLTVIASAPLFVILIIYLIARQFIAGITNVNKVRKFINAALSQKLEAANEKVGVTFRDLHRAKKPPLKIVATNVYAESLELFCLDRTPDVAIADAVAASICLPVIFKPYGLQFDRIIGGIRTPVDSVFQDGGLVSNLPAWPFDVERAQARDIATVAVSIGEPPVATPKPWLSALVGTLVNGSKEVHTRAAGRISQIALKTKLELLDFDAPVDELRAEATRARITSQGQLIEDLYAVPQVVRKFVGIAQQALLSMLTADMERWALVDVPHARLRVGLAVQSLEMPDQFEVVESAGYESDDIGSELMQAFKDHPAISAWTRNEELFLDLKHSTPQKLKQKNIWTDAKFIVCIPMHMSPRATKYTGNKVARGCVVIVESNVIIDMSAGHTLEAFKEFLVSVKSALLQLESKATTSKKIKLADFVQRETKWEE